MSFLRGGLHPITEKRWFIQIGLEWSLSSFLKSQQHQTPEVHRGTCLGNTPLLAVFSVIPHFSSLPGFPVVTSKGTNCRPILYSSLLLGVTKTKIGSKKTILLCCFPEHFQITGRPSLIGEVIQGAVS